MLFQEAWAAVQQLSYVVFVIPRCVQHAACTSSDLTDSIVTHNFSLTLTAQPIDKSSGCYVEQTLIHRKTVLSKVSSTFSEMLSAFGSSQT